MESIDQITQRENIAKKYKKNSEYYNKTVGDLADAVDQAIHFARQDKKQYNVMFTDDDKFLVTPKDRIFKAETLVEIRGFRCNGDKVDIHTYRQLKIAEGVESLDFVFMCRYETTRYPNND